MTSLLKPPERELDGRQPDPMARRDRDSIVAAVSRGDETPEDVEDDAGENFDASSERPLLEKRVAAAQVAVEWTAKHRKRIEDERGKTDSFIKVPGDGVPWNWHDVITVACLLAVSLASLAVATNSLAVALMSTGEAAFNEPIRAYLFSLLPLGAAMALKFCNPPAIKRQHFDFVLGAAGVALAFVWAGLFVLTFDPFGQVDPIGALVDGVFTNGQGPTRPNKALFFVGVLAEICLAATAWRVIDRIVGTHNLTVVADNPEAVALDKQLALAVEANERALAELGGAQTALAQQMNERAGYVAHQGNRFETFRNGICALDGADRNGNSRLSHFSESSATTNGHHAKD